MKELYTLSVLLFVSCHLFAQEYLPMLRSDAEWRVAHSERVPVGEYTTNIFYTEFYRLGADSVMDGQIWKSVYFVADSTFSWDHVELQFAGLIRESEGKVYYRGDHFRYIADDEIMYDFSLEEGDVFWETTDDVGAPVELFVHAVDTIYLADSIPRRTLRFRYYYPYSDFTSGHDIHVWVEGLGDLIYGLIDQRVVAGLDTNNPRTTDRLICYSAQDTLIYQSAEFEDCYYESDGDFPEEPPEWGVEGSYLMYQMVSMSALKYRQYRFAGDTLIADKPARVVKMYDIEYVGEELTRLPDRYLGELYFHLEGDSVYWWRQDIFQFLYDLSPSTFERWPIYPNEEMACPGDPLPPSDELRIWEWFVTMVFEERYLVHLINSGGYWTFGNLFFVGIGPNASLLPQAGNNGCTGIDAGAGILSERLVCYYHPDLGHLRMTTSPLAEDCAALGTLTTTFEPLPLPLQVFPNPTDQQLTIDGLDALDGNAHLLTIFDLWGRPKARIDLRQAGDRYTLDMGDWAAGVYWLRLEGVRHYRAMKIVKL